MHYSHNALFFLQFFLQVSYRCLLLYNIKISLILVNNENIDGSAFDRGMSMEAWLWF